MEPNAKQFITEVDGKTVIFESGMLAGQAGGAVTVRLGDSVVFSAATMIRLHTLERVLSFTVSRTLKCSFIIQSAALP